MEIPQGLRDGIGPGVGEAVLARRHGMVTISGVAIEAGQRVAPTRASGAESLHQDGHESRREKPDPDDAGHMRQRDPNAEPGHREEHRHEHAGRYDQRPKPLEREYGAGLEEPPLQDLTSRFRLRHGTLRFRFSHCSASLGGSEEKGEHPDRNGGRHCGAAPLACRDERSSASPTLARADHALRRRARPKTAPVQRRAPAAPSRWLLDRQEQPATPTRAEPAATTGGAARLQSVSL